ncbi:MAG TPA: archaemetzincin family Zn-dependent metalloprotease [Terriglobia bacterium]|nr:archaemetzincin family Zn-dependent metalloprotease [Terriglobia bacterium]
MRLVQLLPIGAVDGRWLSRMAARLAPEFAARCEVLPAALDPEPSFHPGRGQYCSTELLARMQRQRDPACWRLLGVTALDLYIPILTFVFGEAQMNGGCAVVSSHRLRQEFYGLAPDPDVLAERVLKESVHELGHTLGLTHCEDYNCALAPSHSVEWIDLKGISLCAECRARIDNCQLTLANL